MLVLEEVREDCEQVLIRDIWNKGNHSIQNVRSALSNLRNFILRRLHKQPKVILSDLFNHLLHDVPLVTRRQMRVDDREKFHGGELRVVSLTVHKSFDHLDNLLTQIFNLHHGKNVLNTCHGLQQLVMRNKTYLVPDNSFLDFTESFKWLEKVRSEQWTADVLEECAVECGRQLD